MNLQLTVRDKYTYIATFTGPDKLDVEQLCKIENYDEQSGEISILMSSEVVQTELFNKVTSIESFYRVIDLSCKKRAEDFALWYLSSRDYSCYQIRQKIGEKYVDYITDFVTEKLIDKNFLNDRRFAKRKIQSLTEHKKSSIREIKAEFSLKYRIDREIIDELVNEDSIDEINLINCLLATKYRNKLSSEESIKKVVAALSRKGFKFSQIRTCLEQINPDLKDMH